MVKIPAGEFKAKCLKLMDEVQQLHHAIVITKYGKPVAMLVPALPEKKSQKLFSRSGPETALSVCPVIVSARLKPEKKKKSRPSVRCAWIKSANSIPT